MLLVTTMFLTQVLLRTIWRKALLVAIAVPLSVAKNGLRIFVIGMLERASIPDISPADCITEVDHILRGCADHRVRLDLGSQTERELAIRIAVIVLAFMVSQGTVASAQRS